MNRSVKETATDSRESFSKYFAFHKLPSNSPEIRTALTKAISPGPCVVYKAKTFYLLFWTCTTKNSILRVLGHDIILFIKDLIQDIGTTSLSIKLTDGKTETYGYNDIYPTEKDLQRDVADHCALMYLNVANLLNNSKVRYENDKFYTYVGNILVAINPYKMIKGLYDKNSVERYKEIVVKYLPARLKP
jgi:hypothetical protein